MLHKLENFMANKTKIEYLIEFDNKDGNEWIHSTYFERDLMAYASRVAVKRGNAPWVWAKNRYLPDKILVDNEELTFMLLKCKR